MQKESPVYEGSPPAAPCLASPSASQEDAKPLGDDLHALISRLYPICRSLTGDGVRQTLDVLRERVPLAVHEVPTGEQVFDWVVPKEWNIRDAYIKNAAGERVVDFQSCNLHVVSYSVPVHRRMSLAELRPHLHSLPEQPDWIPHKTSYYREDWGFCIAHRQLCELKEGDYEVCIDSTLEEGALTYGELYLPGATADEVLISCHTCHPSLCNDNLSGIAVATFLAERLAGHSLRYSYRFLFVPATIGSITWLSRNEGRLGNIKHGLVLTCLGDAGSPTYKRSRRGNAEIDRICEHVLHHGGCHRVLDFYPYGYDERQYCSPAFDLPVGLLMRTPHGQFPEYHTSGDSLEFVKPAALADSYERCLEIVSVLERNRSYKNTNPKCEPQLGRRGLYSQSGGRPAGTLERQRAIMWVLNLSDGTHSLLDIADRAKMPFSTVSEAADCLVACGLLKACESGPVQV